MSLGDLERFVSALRLDPDLQRDFAPLRHDLDAAVQWAGERGFQFTREEAEQWASSGELSDDDLEDAAGGAWGDPPPPGSGP
ncbi:MAG TPA: Nif11-like leader peptide family RiPP precursor [Thermoanaerobaculia bacterium]